MKKNGNESLLAGTTGTTVACPNCQMMYLAQQKLAAQVLQLREKQDKILLAVTEIFDEGDGIDFGEQRKG